MRFPYLFYKVNGKYFFRYSKANNLCESLVENDKEVKFLVFHLFRGWLCLFLRKEVSRTMWRYGARL